MAITQCNVTTNVIAQLHDNPVTDDNLTADQFKAKFDEAPDGIKEYINEVLIPELEALFAAIGGAGSVTEAMLGAHIVTNGKLGTDIFPEHVGIKIGTEVPTYGTGEDQIVDGQIYLKYS